MTLIAIIITILYSILIGSLIYGFDNVPNFTLKDLKPKTKFSVIIPFRNEAHNLQTLLESIFDLNYPKGLFEIILVDDASEDGSGDLIIAHLSSNLNAAVCDIRLLSNMRTTTSPKKDAITLAISQAKYDWIITTDADCILPKFWLDSFDEFIQQTQPELIVAPVTYSKPNSFLSRFQLLDVLSLQGSTIGGFGIGKPFMCNGANLGYTKRLFESVLGFRGNDTVASGDDIFMLEKALNSAAEKVQFLKCQQAIVITSPQPTFDTLISQRVRWAAKTSAYKSWFGKIAAVTVFLMNGGLLVFVLMSIIGIIKLKILIYLLVIKFGVDVLLIYKTATFTHQKGIMSSFFVVCIIYPFFTFYVAFASFFKGYKWKGRDYIK